ncbi:MULTISPECIES: lipid A deacylase LpxR family protein [unclassified Wenzhouxiangella]|uniref:lipid A deacylase LpxR family protein n=1 Tax=unclassified Wenzhouxiangella TaxID=2613841 RepID=UPI000E32CA8A|nr:MULTISPECIES: lipid A deacylase LpxR family protein [unclassified Wenzhouxiangella]RFF27522.1 lipid A deacylase LpxR family protein [Wenzhouxiangella sp. 15181]RFP69616.1 lipid A deacylase LpxR family protein [Wenzhouxiangella sp. 15190]
MTRSGRTAWWGIAAALSLIISIHAAGQEGSADGNNDNLEEHAIWIVEYENDIFVDEDRYYTNGIRLSRIGQVRTPPSWLEEVARRFPGIDDADALPYRLSISHNLYTPRDIDNPQFPPDDRPYAAWLNVQFATGTTSERGADRVQVGLGVVGPLAYGEEIQKAIHSAIDSPEPIGWDTQIRNEPTLQVGYDRIRRFFTIGDEEPGGVGLDATWIGGLMLGNAHTHVAAGGFLRAGHNLPRGYGPPRITPSISGAGYFMPSREPSWYLYLGVEGRRVFRDLFIEGNTFGGVDGVSRKRNIGEVFGGLVYTRGPLRLAYTQVWRTREFVGQVEGQTYGALSFSLWW